MFKILIIQLAGMFSGTTTTAWSTTTRIAASTSTRRPHQPGKRLSKIHVSQATWARIVPSWVTSCKDQMLLAWVQILPLLDANSQLWSM